MSIDPLKGVYINNNYYNYEPETFNITRSLRNNSQPVQRNTNLNRSFAINGLLPEIFTLSIVLDTTYAIWNGQNYSGSTTWIGMSRLIDLYNTCNARGSSMPINFVAPNGLTFSVVPTGSLDIRPFNPTNPTSTGMEYRVTLTLESI